METDGSGVLHVRLRPKDGGRSRPGERDRLTNERPPDALAAMGRMNHDSGKPPVARPVGIPLDPAEPDYGWAFPGHEDGLSSRIQYLHLPPELVGPLSDLQFLKPAPP